MLYIYYVFNYCLWTKILTANFYEQLNYDYELKYFSNLYYVFICVFKIMYNNVFSYLYTVNMY